MGLLWNCDKKASVKWYKNDAEFTEEVFLQKLETSIPELDESSKVCIESSEKRKKKFTLHINTPSGTASNP